MGSTVNMSDTNPASATHMVRANGAALKIEEINCDYFFLANHHKEMKAWETLMLN